MKPAPGDRYGRLTRQRANGTSVEVTERQLAILNAIERHIEKNGMPPTREDLCKRFVFRTPNAAEDHLKRLARKGLVKLIPGISRGIQLT